MLRVSPCLRTAALLIAIVAPTGTDAQEGADAPAHPAPTLLIQHASSLEGAGLRGGILNGTSLVVLGTTGGARPTVEECAETRVEYKVETPASAGDVPKSVTRNAYAVTIHQYLDVHGTWPDTAWYLADAAGRPVEYVCVATNRFRLADVAGVQRFSASVVRQTTESTDEARSFGVEHLGRAGLSSGAWRPGTFYEFDPVYAVSPPRPMVGFVYLGDEVRVGSATPEEGEVTLDRTLTTVGTDVPLSMFYRGATGAGVAEHFRFNVATSTAQPGQHLFVGLSLMTLVLGARSGEVPFDAVVSAHFGPNGIGRDDEESPVAVGLQLDVAGVLKETRSLLGF